MHVAHERLPGLDRDRILAVVGSVLSAHGVDGVELVWRTDRSGWVLELTVERPDARRPGDGVTLDLCSDISRDLSAALDVADVIPQRYRLEVGSPGVERSLYVARDYARFAGMVAKVKLREPLEDGQRVVSGTLHGLDEAGQVVLETDRGLLSLPLDALESGRLVFDWNVPAVNKNQRTSARKARRRIAGRGK
ncbi:MAG: ribosome maturation factor RimP [Polyangiaceae bacterium]|nr:ribosome maturation factor RimP [Polyangiaceae bacterium]